MKLSLFILSFTIFLAKTNFSMAQENKSTKHIVYLLPGQGADHRLFNNLVLDNKFEIKHIRMHRPERKISMEEYAHKLSEQIDTSMTFSIVGVSLGGMLSVELNEIVKPKNVIIISSAKHRKELPLRYRFMRQFPINKIIPAGLYKAGARVAQPIVEPDRKHGKEIFVQMLKDKDAKFLKRTTNMIIHWEREASSQNIVHIHGTNDHTIPSRNVKSDFIVQKGSHMMVLTRGEEVSTLINEILLEEIVTTDTQLK